MATKSEISSWRGSFPLRFSDGGSITLTIHRNATNVFHTIWCYALSNTTGPSASWPEDKRKLLAYEDGIKWGSSDPLFGTYKITLPESIESLFDFTSNPSNNTVNKIGIKVVTYSNNSYSGNSIIGSSQIFDTIFTVAPSEKMYPQVTLSISDTTNAYNASGGQYFYIGEDAAHSSNGYIKFNVRYWEGHEEGKSESFSINNQDITSQITDDGFAYTVNNIKDNQNKTTFSYTVIDGKGLKTQIANSDPIIKYWTDHVSLMTQFNNLKENRDDEERYDYKEGKTPVPASLYLAPDWLPNQYTTAEPPNDWEYFADIGDDATGLINQRNILNDRKRELNLQLYRKYYKYIQEGTWLDDQYIDDDLYYLDANKILNQSSYPKATYTIDVVDIEGIPKYAAYTFQLGQRTYVEDPDMFGYTYLTVAGNENVKTPFKKEVIISERSRNLDDPSKSTIKVQTYKNQWEDIFSSITATTQSLQYASGGYNRAANAVNPNGSINVHSLEQTFQSGQFALSGSATQSITWDASYGIEITDLSNNLVKLRIASNGLAITTDGGTTWNNAITGNGINTNYLLAGQIDASKINIISAAGDYAFSWNEKGLNAILPNYTDEESEPAYGEAYVRFNNLGIYGTKRGAEIEEALALLPASATEQDKINAIKEYTNFFLNWDELYLSSQDIDGNVIKLNPDVGLEIYSADGSYAWDEDNNTIYNVDVNGNVYQDGDSIPVLTLGEFAYSILPSGYETTYGLLVRNKQGMPTLYTDSDGDLTMIGDITANSITVNNGYLKRLYLEKNYNSSTTSGRTSYLGTNKDESQALNDSDILISLGKAQTGASTYSHGNFIVRADGKYFGELAALNYVDSWGVQSYSENTEPNQTAYAILLGHHSQTVEQTTTNYIFSAFKIDDPNVHTQSAAKRVFDIQENGTVDLEGVLNARNGVKLTGSLMAYDPDDSLKYIIINGDTGTIGHSTNSWFIDETGYAEFQNARIRGKLSTIVFEKEKVSMIGGDLVISPTFYIEKEIIEDTVEGGWDVSNLGLDNYYTDFSGNDNPNQVIFYIADSEESNEFDGQYYFGVIIKEGTQEPYSYFLDNDSPSESDEQLINKLYSISINSTPYHGSLTEGSNIILANFGTNVIRLTANQTEGATIKVMGSLNNDVQSQLGWINFDGDARTAMRQTAQGQYGLYSENAFLEGKLYLPQVGLTNDNELPLGIDLIENPYIRLSAKIQFSLFVVNKQSHPDFANFYNIFGKNNGYAVLKEDELYYLITVRAMLASDEVYGYAINFVTSFTDFPVDEIQNVYSITLQVLNSAPNEDIPAGALIYKMPDTFLGHVIRFWAGQDPLYKATAPFIITQEGSLYANNGYFKGTVISNNAILGQDNGIGGATDYIRIMMGAEGLTSIEIQSKQLNSRFDDLDATLRLYTDNRIAETINYVDEQIGIISDRVTVTENDLSIINQYLTLPPNNNNIGYTELRSNGNVTLRLTDSFLSIRNNSISTSGGPDAPILTYWMDNMQINPYGVRIGRFAWISASSGNLQLKKVV